MTEKLELIWNRPESSEYPKVWCTFKASDINTDAVVEYRIQDLPESRIQDGIDFMAQHFCSDEPICEALEVSKDIDAIEDFKLLWKLIFKQKMVLACFKSGSDQIVGMNATFVKCKDDHFMEVLYTQIKSEKIRQYAEMMFLLRENFNIFEVYELDKHLSCIGLVIDRTYRRRGIAEQFLRCREAICREFGIRMTSTVFTADSSNRIADKVRFKMDKIIRYKDLCNAHPLINSLKENIKSDAMTIKSIVF
ncbi:uncharacterized protein LOC129573781 [Sitodiplosis mosellana]|uniref:uncharacterized protein LOC129573781 n=1 Tax=Sitodiplosis mosellana TaxID=263140 RepID=UPI0024439361|nr:uncharacterized protein LOC129573781 [Sitodiplosis mosellana]